VKNNLRLLMAEHRVNITQLAAATGISRNTLSSIYHERTTRMDFKTVTMLCNYFECTPNDLLHDPRIRICEVRRNRKRWWKYKPLIQAIEEIVSEW
jgi:putative transcriptional regulator